MAKASVVSIHQMIIGAMVGDAISDHAFMLRDALREWGYQSHIYAQYIHPGLSKEVRPYTDYQPTGQDILIFHYSIGSEVSEYVASLSTRLVMIYHNVTPAEYFRKVDHALFEQMEKGRQSLVHFRDKIELALADSEFNRLDLVQAGYTKTGVLPVALDEERYSQAPSQELMARFGHDGYTNLLFVGRIVPNKKQEDVIKALYYYKRINPRSRLFLVGPHWEQAEVYLNWLQDLALYLNLPDVHFCGHVPFDELLAYYRLADVFVCMSEHEGFCKPLVESMYFDVPIVAYDATAVPYTLGGAGILVKEKRYDVVAETIHLLVTDANLRQRIIAGQRERLRHFLKSPALATFKEYIKPLTLAVADRQAEAGGLAKREEVL